MRRPAWSQAARYCLGLAWLVIFPTVLLGFMDWQHYYQGAWLLPIIVKIGLASFLFVLLSIGLILVITGREESKALLAIYVIAFLTVGGLGYFGGRLVFGGRAPAAPPALQAGQGLFENNCMACHPNGGNAITPQDIIIGSDRLKDFPTFLSWIGTPGWITAKRGPCPTFCRGRSAMGKPGNYMTISSGFWESRRPDETLPFRRSGEPAPINPVMTGHHRALRLIRGGLERRRGWGRAARAALGGSSR